MHTQKARLLLRPLPGQPADASRKAAGLTFHAAAARQPTGWIPMDAGAQATVAELWDAAYEQIESTGAKAEPDVENAWVLPTPRGAREVFAGSPDSDRGRVNDYAGDCPSDPAFAWHLGDRYTELAKARASLTNHHPVRAAIFDVGFDFKHSAMPAHLRLDLQKNFVGDRRGDATDPDIGGLLQNPGHGTATIALLAGRELQAAKDPRQNGICIGGAPDIEVVPVRIATSVVMLRTSAFAEALTYITGLSGDPATAVDLVSMSMGGVASYAWADAVNAAYDKGILLVTAAGNNFGLPKTIIYPALFRRVLAACGIMADFTPYDLGFGRMSGNYGPNSKMDTALAAFTPNVPWAEIGGKGDIVDWDGRGTSSATPQIAAAAALWLHEHKAQLHANARHAWQRVEAIRAALFEKADRSLPDSRRYFGQGVLKAHRALSVAPTAAAIAALVQQPRDTAAFAFLRTLFGAARTPTAIDDALDLELTQLWQRDPRFESTLGDFDAASSLQEEKLREVVEASPYASRRLKAELGRTPLSTSRSTVAVRQGDEFHPPPPTERRLRVFAFDPAASLSAATAGIATTTIQVPWEDVEPGPSGEYVEVIDHDPASGCFYAPIDLNNPRLLATDGLAPAEGDPKFHQQMVYAVAMRTIQSFERSLGRRALWSSVTEGFREMDYVARLRIYPHALRARNAYYNPLKKAVLFGYFPATPLTLNTVNPGGMVFTCLSHDIVAHEMTHALLDGMARGLASPTNEDMLAFHEALADLVALFQHFSLPGVLDRQLARTRGNLRMKSYLVQLAEQFGQGTGLHGALRSYLGETPDPTLLARTREPHARGAILVAAVFDAFVTIYENRIADLKRIASEGTGVLREGDLHPDLVSRFAAEAAKAASQLLRMCIRAVDYCPPVDLTFGDFLRALITADTDLYPDDPLAYRPAIIDAFRQRGIYPRDVRAMSQDSLCWRPPGEHLIGEFGRTHNAALLTTRLRLLGDLVRRISRSSETKWPIPDHAILDAYCPVSRPRPMADHRRPKTNKPKAREAVYYLLLQERVVVHDLLVAALKELPQDSRDAMLGELGVLRPGQQEPSFEVYALNFAEREDESGSVRRDFILSLRSNREGRVGGCTLIANCDTGEIRYMVRKRWASESRYKAIQAFRASGSGVGQAYLVGTPFCGPGSRFAMIHDHIAEIGKEEGYA